MSSFPSPFMPRRRPEDELDMLAPIGGIGIGRFAGTPGGSSPVSAPDPGVAFQQTFPQISQSVFGQQSFPNTPTPPPDLSAPQTDKFGRPLDAYSMTPSRPPTYAEIQRNNATEFYKMPQDQQDRLTAATEQMKNNPGPITPRMGGLPGMAANAMGIQQTGYEPVAGPLERTFVDVGGRVGNIASPIANTVIGGMKFAGYDPPQTLQDIGNLSRDSAQYSAEHPPTSYPEAITRRVGGAAATAMSLYGSPVLNAAGRIGGIVGNAAGPIGRFAGGIAGFEAGQAVPEYLANQPTYGSAPGPSGPSGGDVAERIAKSPLEFGMGLMHDPTPDFSSPQSLYSSTAPMEQFGVLGGLHLANRAAPEPRVTPAEASGAILPPSTVEARRGSQPSPETAMRVLNPGMNMGNLFMAKDAADGAGKEIKLDPELTVTPQEKPLFPVGIKKTSVGSTLESVGAEPVKEWKSVSFPELDERSKSALAINPNKGKEIFADLMDKPRALKLDETPIALHEWAKKNKEIEDIRSARDAAVASGNDADVGAAKIAMARAVDEARDMAKVLDYSGSEKGAALAAQKMMKDAMGNLYSLPIMLNEKEAAGSGEKLTPEKQAEVEAAHDKIKTTKDAYEQASGKATEAQRTEARDETATKIEQEADTEQRVERVKTGKVSTPKPEDIDGIKAKYEDTEKTPQDLSNAAKELEKHFYKQGMKDREQRTEAVHNELVKIDPELSKSDTMDALSGYGKYKLLNKGELESALRQGHGEMQQLRKLEDMQGGKAPLKTGMERREPSDLERKLIKQVNEMKKKGGFNTTDPAKQLKTVMESMRTRLTNSMADYKDRLARGDFSTKTRTPVELTPDIKNLKAEHERAKIEWQKGLAKDRHDKRFWWEKAFDAVGNFKRFAVLTSPAVLPKLAAAGAARVATKPMELATSGAWAKVFPEIAKGAPLEGQGLNIKAEAQAAGQALQSLGKEMWNKVKSGHADIDVLHGDQRKNDITEFGALMGRIHGVLKEPVRQMDFYSSQAKLLEAAARNGEDITDKTVIAKAGAQALQHADAQIFQQKDNRVTQFTRNAIRILEAETQKLHDRPKDANLTKAIIGKAGATAIKTLMPIVSVPTNIATETGVHVAGLPTGIAEAVYHTWKGAEKLPPEQKDMVMRHLAKGTLGAAALLTGFFNPSSIGGYYQPGKRDPNDTAFGSIKIMGKNIPSLLLHNPLLEVLQIGATIRRVYDAKKSKGESGPSAMFSGLASGAGGAAMNVPVARESIEIGKMLEPGNDKPILNFGKSLIVPQAVNFVSKKAFGKDLIYGPKKEPTPKAEPKKLMSERAEAFKNQNNDRSKAFSRQGFGRRN